MIFASISPELFDLDLCDFEDLSDFTDSFSILLTRFQFSATAFVIQNSIFIY